MDIQHAIAAAASAREPELRRLYMVAVARGGNDTGLTAEEERELEWPRLLTLALLWLPDLVLSGHLLDTTDDELTGGALAIRTASDVSAGALRLAHRALEVHGRQVGYLTGPWIEAAVSDASDQLAQYAAHPDAGQPMAVAEAQAATVSLALATERTDPMLLAEQLADALGHLLAFYAIARAASPPVDKQIRVRARPQPERLTLVEAQRRAPFTVLIPAWIPFGWRMRCVFIAPFASSPAQAVVIHSSEDGQDSFSLSQSSATAREPVFGELAEDERWEEVAPDGTVIRVTTAGPHTRAYVERHGTFVLLASETLSSDQLATIASSLKPAPGAGGI